MAPTALLAQPHPLALRRLGGGQPGEAWTVDRPDVLATEHHDADVVEVATVGSEMGGTVVTGTVERESAHLVRLDLRVEPPRLGR
ncbi:hypothetical protein GCM10009710_18360 [Aeromicrobium alkaliterrae]|uniref:Uncharacterized protein n=1 Tax=Aeromicrobium alkaliterrae TaxID=302168 RepID=A0ABN2JTB7_9ACTN